MTLLSLFLKKSIFLITFISLTHCHSGSLPATTTSTETSTPNTFKRPAPRTIDTSQDVVDTVLQTPHFRFITHNSVLDTTNVKEIAVARESNLKALQALIGNSQKVVPINYHIYPSIEQKAMREKTIKIASLDEGNNSIYVVENQHFQGSQQSLESTLLIRQLLSKPIITALEDGLSKHLRNLSE